MMSVVVGRTKTSAQAEEIKWESATIEDIEILASTPVLFGGAKTFVFRDALQGERAEEFLALAKTLVKSVHTFIFEEEKLLKRETEILTKAGAEIELGKKETKEYKFDPFGLTFAFAARDRKKLWIALVQALRAGEKPEAVAGLLHWKVRDLLSKSSSHYSKDDLKRISRELVFLYHDSHRGAGDLELLLERFALKL